VAVFLETHKTPLSGRDVKSQRSNNKLLPYVYFWRLTLDSSSSLKKIEK